MATTALTEKAAITITATAEAGPTEEVTGMVAGEATEAAVGEATEAAVEAATDKRGEAERADKALQAPC